MLFRSNPLTRWRRPLLVILFSAICFAQPAVTLEQATSRTGNDSAPAYDGKEVKVHGEVAALPIRALDAYYLPIFDKDGYGLVLQGPLNQFAQLAPGAWITASGTIATRAGMPVLIPKEIVGQSGRSRPAPRELPVPDLNGFRDLGLMVTTEGRITSLSSTSAGDALVIADKDSSLTVFLPKSRAGARSAFDRFNIGDRVRITGLATQYCPLPPYDRSFQILVRDANAVTLVRRSGLFPPMLLITAMIAIGLILAVWWVREHRMAAQRKVMRSLNSLGEEIVAAGSPGEILKKLADVVPEVSGATGVRLYIFNRKTRALERVLSQAEPDPLSISIESPVGPLPTGAALCYRNRTLLNVPDTRRSPFFKAGSKTELPRSVMFVPMFAQNDLMGVLEVDHAEGIRYFTHEEQAATQHLANQVATSLKLQEQQSMREQLFRSEKLAATGQLISGVANELRAPLETILAVSKFMLARGAPPSAERELRVLAAEAQRAAEIVARLVSFGRAEEVEAKPVEVNGLITSLMRFREREWKTLGIEVQNRLSRDPLYSVGAQGQLEQVFLNLLVHAEQSAAESTEKLITVDSTAVGRNLLVEICYSVAPSDAATDPFAENAGASRNSLGLGVARGVIQGHGGEIRFSKASSKLYRFEIELPLKAGTQSTRVAGAVARNGRQLTSLVVEPDPAIERQLVEILSAREHRVVPVSSAEEGIDLIQRARFDSVLCSVRLPGLNWVEFFERVRDHTSAFVLLSEGYDPDLGRAFRRGEGYVLSKPLQDGETDRVLTQVESYLDRQSIGQGLGARG
jgi:signal transduction histidine kinase/CheY-like chemotaxis protein